MVEEINLKQNYNVRGMVCESLAQMYTFGTKDYTRLQLTRQQRNVLRVLEGVDLYAMEKGVPVLYEVKSKKENTDAK